MSKPALLEELRRELERRNPKSRRAARERLVEELRASRAADYENIMKKFNEKYDNQFNAAK